MPRRGRRTWRPRRRRGRWRWREPPGRHSTSCISPAGRHSTSCASRALRGGVAVEKRSWRESFDRISNGAPGIETLLTLVYSEGVAAGRISLERMVDLLATTPARLFGVGSEGGGGGGGGPARAVPALLVASNVPGPCV